MEISATVSQMLLASFSLNLTSFIHGELGIERIYKFCRWAQEFLSNHPVIIRILLKSRKMLQKLVSWHGSLHYIYIPSLSLSRSVPC